MPAEAPAVEAAPAAAPSPLKFLGPQWFATVMGLSGLALAWVAAVPRMGEAAVWVARGIGLVAALTFLLLLALFVRRGQLHPEAISGDLQHPLRHAFVAALPVSLILLATLGAALFSPSVFWETLWLIACLLQFAVTLWVLSRWWRGNAAGGFQWPGITPVLIIPVVGNVLAPLAGVALGQTQWAALQFGVGAFLWPVVITLIFVRIGVQGQWPERLLPSGFITVAPPAVIGLALLPLGASPAWSQACWGIALFFLLWAAQALRAIVAQPFSMAWWALSFPLAAFAALTLRLASTGQPFAFLSVPVLALATLVIAWLCLQTLRGLHRGMLLVAEG
jgi:tellurite resistance protein